ncbi:MAG: hypothetical protein HYZ29_13975 [Myxococcales bacterium]|nr:hypothetical protein [Myxococcales bacterium]
MARVIDLTPRFLARLDALGVQRGSGASKAIGATIAALANEPSLPGPGDALAATPPAGTAWVRRVPGHNLWLWFTASEAHLVVWSLHRRPPVPLDPDLA